MDDRHRQQGSILVACTQMGWRGKLTGVRFLGCQLSSCLALVVSHGTILETYKLKL